MKFLILALTLVCGLHVQAANLDPIINFDIVTDGIFRGARPTSAQIDWLATAQVKTVINLQGGDAQIPLIGLAVPLFVKGELPEEIAQEGNQVRSLGMTYVSLPLSSLKPVSKDEALSIAQALKMMSDPRNQPVYIHCAHGKDRTGLVVALYRMIYQNWSVQQAHAEMIAKGHDGIHMAVTFSLDQYLYTYAFASYIREIMP